MYSRTRAGSQNLDHQTPAIPPDDAVSTVARLLGGRGIPAGDFLVAGQPVAPLSHADRRVLARVATGLQVPLAVTMGLVDPTWQ